MAECKEKLCASGGESQRRYRPLEEAITLSQTVDEKGQVLPPPGSRGFITEATCPEFKNIAVELFRRYFSPDMYFVFPLICGQEAALGLDFRTTTTTVFFGPKAFDQRAATDERPQ